MTDSDAAFTPLCDWSNPGAAAGAHLLVHDAAGRVLLQLRDGAPGDAVPWAYPGLWSLFGGGVEPGETLREAAVRELAEETGLTAPPETLTPLTRVLSRWSDRRLRLYVYAVPLPASPGTIRLGEGAGFAMMTAAQAAAHPLIPEIRLVLAHFFATRG